MTHDAATGDVANQTLAPGSSAGIDAAARQRLDAIESDLLVLRRAINDKARPWYQQAPVLVSMAALVFSFGTTAVSAYRTSNQDIHAARAQLMSIITQLNDLAHRALRAEVDYASNPATKTAALNAVNITNAVLAKLGDDVLKRIPSNATPTEYIYIAQAMSNAGRYDRSIALSQMAADRANDDDVAEKSTALQQVGVLYFLKREFEAGRRTFERALTDVRTASGIAEDVKRVALHMTEIRWAQAEAFIGERENALNHARAALDHLNGVFPQFAEPALAATQALIARIQSGQPLPVSGDPTRPDSVIAPPPPGAVAP
ncbi:MAG TPA: hypothetical protein VKA21_10410 [Candidatus Binatia bacterium]|nr:hypothetical protein [Candidatus Binatia bacterium]